ncbi:MAG: KOW domain-containing RNA-binding protein [Bacillota bacterium]
MVELQPGQLVRSLAGRDKDEHYLVLREIDDQYVYLVNGHNRPVSKPKKKNKAHIQHYDRRVDLKELVETGKLNDSQVIEYLRKLLVPETEVSEEEV